MYSSSPAEFYLFITSIGRPTPSANGSYVFTMLVKVRNHHQISRHDMVHNYKSTTISANKLHRNDIAHSYKLVTAISANKLNIIDTVRTLRHFGPTHRFESAVSAGRKIPSASPIDLPLSIPEDPLPSSAKGGRGQCRRMTVEVCV